MSDPNTAAPSLLEVSGLTRTFGHAVAVSNVSFSLGKSECLALFGPNGAGKTTLLRLTAALLRPTSGTVRLDGFAIPTHPELRGRIGLISHRTMLYEALSPRENVVFAAQLFGIEDHDGAAEAALSRMGMLERADVPVRALSRGMQQRVSIARAIVHSPGLVLADEPYTGLDESGARALTGLLGELMSSGTAIIVVTHNIAAGLALATRAAVMHRGTIVRTDEREHLDAAGYAQIYSGLVGANV